MDIKKFDLNSGEQEREDLEYWKSKSPQEKLDVLEKIRKAGSKINESGEINGDFEGLRRVFRITKQK